MKEQNKKNMANGIATFITEGLDGWQAGFEIGVQSFYLQPVSPKKGHEEDTADKAKWYQHCLEKAFKNLTISSPSTDQLRSALQRLVDLKDLKDREGKSGYYETHQPAAWEQARKALASYSVSGDGQEEVDPQEIWDEFSEHIDNDLFSLERVAGSTIMTYYNFKKFAANYHITKK